MINGDTTFLQEIGLPVTVLVLVAWLLPKALARVIGEGVAKLFVIGALATVLLWIGAGAYIWASELPLAALGEALGSANLAEVFLYVLTQGARAAIIWAPVMVLSVSALPKRWKEAVW